MPPGERVPLEPMFGALQRGKGGAPRSTRVALVSLFQAGLGLATLELCSPCRRLACLGKATGLLLSLGKDYFFYSCQPLTGPLGLLASLQDSGLEGSPAPGRGLRNQARQRAEERN